MRILIIEDETDLSREIAAQVDRAGFAADCAESLMDARTLIADRPYVLALLDRRLPDGDGITLVQDLRRTSPNVRIIVLSARDTTRDKVQGLEAGADDYLTKPFEPDELIARVRAMLRRRGDAGPPVKLGNVTFDLNNLDVSIAGVPLILQKRELALLEALLRRAGRVALRDALAEEVFGATEEIHWNTLNVLVSQLRRRLKESSATIEIMAARGIGYFVTASKS